MLYYLPSFKKDHLKTALHSLLIAAQSRKEIALKTLAAVAGKIVSADMALGPVMRIMMRSLHSLIAEKAFEGGLD